MAHFATMLAGFCLSEPTSVSELSKARFYNKGFYRNHSYQHKYINHQIVPIRGIRCFPNSSSTYKIRMLSSKSVFTVNVGRPLKLLL